MVKKFLGKKFFDPKNVKKPLFLAYLTEKALYLVSLLSSLELKRPMMAQNVRNAVLKMTDKCLKNDLKHKKRNFLGQRW